MAIQEGKRPKTLKGILKSIKVPAKKAASSTQFPLMDAMAAGKPIGDKELQASAKKH